MKKFLLSFALTLVFGVAVFAQTNIVLSKNGIPYANGDVITISDVQTTMTLHLDVQNTSGSSMDVKCRIKAIQQASGSELGVCWGVCQSPAPPVNGPVTIAAGATSSEFESDYKHQGNAGLTSIRYTFFNSANANDSACVICNFEGYLGLGETMPSFSFSDAYPNPANNAVVFTYQLGNITTAKVVIRDLLGKEVTTANIDQQEGKLRITTDQMINGIYFYSVVADDKIITTKKLVIKH